MSPTRETSQKFFACIDLKIERCTTEITSERTERTDKQVGQLTDQAKNFMTPGRGRTCARCSSALGTEHHGTSHLTMRLNHFRWLYTLVLLILACEAHVHGEAQHARPHYNEIEQCSATSHDGYAGHCCKAEVEVHSPTPMQRFPADNAVPL